MIRLVRAELRKYTTTRLSWAMLIALFITGAAFAALFGGLMIYGQIDGPGGASIRAVDVMSDLALVRYIYTTPVTVAYVLTLSIGVLMIGQEFRHKTATSTFLAVPRRSKVVVAKSLALIVIAAVSGLAHLVGAILGAAPFLLLNDISLFPDAAALTRALALGLLVLGLWGLMGLGIGVLIPNQIVALFVAIGVAWIVEPLLGLALSFVSWGEGLARFFPSQASQAAMDSTSGLGEDFTQAFGGGADPLSWWVAALVLVAYGAIMAGVGLILTRRRDID